MSGLSKRVSKIFRKTHIFISAAEFRLARDCTKARLDDENVDPDEYKLALERLEALWQDYIDSNGAEEKLSIWKEEVAKNVPAAHLAFCSKQEAHLCEVYPNGVWLDKANGERWLSIISSARSYFKWKKD